MSVTTYTIVALKVDGKESPETLATVQKKSGSKGVAASSKCSAAKKYMIKVANTIRPDKSRPIKLHMTLRTMHPRRAPVVFDTEVERVKLDTPVVRTIGGKEVHFTTETIVKSIQPSTSES